MTVLVLELDFDPGTCGLWVIVVTQQGGLAFHVIPHRLGKHMEMCLWGVTSLQFVEAFSPTAVCFGGEQNCEGYGPQSGQYLRRWGGVVTLKLYLVTNSEAVGALIAQEDQQGANQPIYYVSRMLKDGETRYSRAKKASLSLSLIYAAQRLRH